MTGRGSARPTWRAPVWRVIDWLMWVGGWLGVIDSRDLFSLVGLLWVGGWVGGVVVGGWLGGKCV
jgi:hypothetical protein